MGSQGELLKLTREDQGSPQASEACKVPEQHLDKKRCLYLAREPEEPVLNSAFQLLEPCWSYCVTQIWLAYISDGIPLVLRA